jgi:hypothetical protein
MAVPECKWKRYRYLSSLTKFSFFYREFVNYNQNSRNSINVTRTLSLKHQKNLASRWEKLVLISCFFGQCSGSGSMTFWCWSGSGSTDPCLWLMDPNSDPDLDANPDPLISVIGLHKANKNQYKKKNIFLLLLEGTFTSFFQPHNRRNQGFS